MQTLGHYISQPLIKLKRLIKNWRNGKRSLLYNSHHLRAAAVTSLIGHSGAEAWQPDDTEPKKSLHQPPVILALDKCTDLHKAIDEADGSTASPFHHSTLRDLPANDHVRIKQVKKNPRLGVLLQLNDYVENIIDGVKLHNVGQDSDETDHVLCNLVDQPDQFCQRLKTLGNEAEQAISLLKKNMPVLPKLYFSPATSGSDMMYLASNTRKLRQYMALVRKANQSSALYTRQLDHIDDLLKKVDGDKNMSAYWRAAVKQVLLLQDQIQRDKKTFTQLRSNLEQVRGICRRNAFQHFCAMLYNNPYVRNTVVTLFIITCIVCGGCAAMMQVWVVIPEFLVVLTSLGLPELFVAIEAAIHSIAVFTNHIILYAGALTGYVHKLIEISQQANIPPWAFTLTASISLIIPLISSSTFGLTAFCLYLAPHMKVIKASGWALSTILPILPMTFFYGALLTMAVFSSTALGAYLLFPRFQSLYLAAQKNPFAASIVGTAALAALAVLFAGLTTVFIDLTLLHLVLTITIPLLIFAFTAIVVSVFTAYLQHRSMASYEKSQPLNHCELLSLEEPASWYSFILTLNGYRGDEIALDLENRYNTSHEKIEQTWIPNIEDIAYLSPKECSGAVNNEAFDSIYGDPRVKNVADLFGKYNFNLNDLRKANQAFGPIHREIIRKGRYKQACRELKRLRVNYDALYFGKNPPQTQKKTHVVTPPPPNHSKKRHHGGYANRTDYRRVTPALIFQSSLATLLSAPNSVVKGGHKSVTRASSPSKPRLPHQPYSYIDFETLQRRLEMLGPNQQAANGNSHHTSQQKSNEAYKQVKLKKRRSK